jgi:gas vesicle protein
MSQRDNFVGGFVVGAIVGGLVGGVVGVLLASRRLNHLSSDPLLNTDQQDAKAGSKKRSLTGSTEQEMEVARRNLEGKIAQLNDAIDDVRQQLGTVHGGQANETGTRSLAQDP